jgi:hypothetical protein
MRSINDCPNEVPGTLLCTHEELRLLKMDDRIPLPRLDNQARANDNAVVHAEVEVIVKRRRAA